MLIGYRNQSSNTTNGIREEKNQGELLTWFCVAVGLGIGGGLMLCNLRLAGERKWAEMKVWNRRTCKREGEEIKKVAEMRESTAAQEQEAEPANGVVLWAGIMIDGPMI